MAAISDDLGLVPSLNVARRSEFALQECFRETSGSLAASVALVTLGDRAVTQHLIRG